MSRKDDQEPLHLRDLEGYRSLRYTDPEPERDYGKYYDNNKTKNGCLVYFIIFIGLTIIGIGLGKVLSSQDKNKEQIENTVKKLKLKNTNMNAKCYQIQHTR